MIDSEIQKIPKGLLAIQLDKKYFFVIRSRDYEKKGILFRC